VAAYVNKRLSLRDVLKAPADGFAYIADIADDLRYRSVVTVRADAIPETYLPPPDSYYASEPVNIDIALGELAAVFETDLLSLRLIRGSGVDFGTASISTLGPILAATGELAESIAERKFTSRQRGRRVSKRVARTLGTFQYVTEKAASFSVILRPLVTQLSFPGFDDRPREIVQDMLTMLEQSQEYGSVLRIAEEYGDDVIRKLQQLVDAISSYNVDLGFEWADLASRATAGTTTTSPIAEAISHNIQRLELEGSRELSWTGMFTALDVRRRRYSFESEDGSISTGQFSGDLGKPLRSLNFEEAYRVRISRSTLAGVRKARVRDLIIEVATLGLFGSNLADEGPEGDADDSREGL
jgi:hypothetical protein